MLSKRIIILLAFSLMSNWGFSQSELYVLLKKPVNNTPSSKYGISTCRIGDYRPWYIISHNTGNHNIGGDILNVVVDYGEAYNDDPGDHCSGPCGQYQTYCDGKEVEKTLNHFDRVDVNYTGPDPIECIARTCLPINYHAILLPKISTLDEVKGDVRCERDVLFEQYSDEQNHNVTGLVWEYVDKNGNWKELPNYKSRYPLNVSLLDIFGTNWRDKFTGNLQLQFKFTAPFTSDVVYSIQKYTITLTECSPDFESYYNLSNTTCSYKSDGKVSVKLSNNINSTEQLAVALFKKGTVNGDILIDQYSTKQLSLTDTTVLVLKDLGGGFFGFNWPKDIDAGSYYFRYQVLSKATTPPKPKATDPFWYTLVKTPNFMIEKATNVDFTAKRVNDESCFEAGDGKIQVEVTSGETGRLYFYILYKIEGTTEIVERGWTSLSGTTTIISGLGKGKYKIKVKDSEDCLAK